MIKEYEEKPTTMVDCFKRELCAKHCLAYIHEEKEKKIKVRGQYSTNVCNSSGLKSTEFQAKSEEIATTSGCYKYGRNHYGVCKQGTNLCFKCGKDSLFI